MMFDYNIFFFSFISDEVKEDHAVAEKRRVRRAPVLWSPEDQAAFFEALNEHGISFNCNAKVNTFLILLFCCLCLQRIINISVMAFLLLLYASFFLFFYLYYSFPIK